MIQFISEERILSALENGYLKLYLQPIIDVETYEIIGAEALIRWMEPNKKKVTPDYFMPSIRLSKHRFDITKYVLKMASEIIRTLLEKGLPGYISLNMDPEEIFHGMFPKDLEKIVGIENLKYLEIEMTETQATFEDEPLKCKIKRLKKLGLKFALDDFGTGYNNYGVLMYHNFDKIKIDRAFMFDRNPINDSVIQNIVTIAKLADAKCVIEGIETPSDLVRAKTLGGRYMQGYFFGRPMPLEKYIELLSKGLHKCAS